MKQNVSPVVAVVLVIAVVAAACYFGFKAMNPVKATGGPQVTQQDYASRMAEMQRKQMQGIQSNTSNPSGYADMQRRAMGGGH